MLISKASLRLLVVKIFCCITLCLQFTGVDAQHHHETELAQAYLKNNIEPQPLLAQAIRVI